MKEVQTVAPPPRRTNSGTGRVQRARAWMQDHPGQWMIINRYATHDGCSNTRAQLRKDGFEAVARATERRNGRRVELWARWPGV